MASGNQPELEQVDHPSATARNMETGNVALEQDPLLNRPRALSNFSLDDASLLGAGFRSPSSQHDLRRRRRRLYKWATAIMVVFFLTITLLLSRNTGPVYWKPPPNGPQLRNNGTELFKETVVLISLDGFRREYLDRELTPNLQRLRSTGVQAEYMESAFPSTTFANHYSLVTGLFPESHGIVGNTFYDPLLNDTFVYTMPSRSLDSKWWGGEPIWVSAVKQGQKTAVHMWPGSSSKIQGHYPTYYDAYDSRVGLDEKADRIIEWLDLPFQARPSLIAVYVSDIDSQGHEYGPDSKPLNLTLSRVDGMIKRLNMMLERRNLSEIVNLVIVSDHGMTATSMEKQLVLADWIDVDLVSAVHGYPLAEVWPKDMNDVENLYKKLKESSTGQPFEVYQRDQVPAVFHHRSTQRIAPIVCIPDLGYQFSLNKQQVSTKGMHGYDPRDEDMHAIFLAKGPAFTNNVTVKAFQNVQLYGLLSRVLHIDSATNNGSEFWLDRSGILLSTAS